jgi:hypothetical protein
MLQGMDVKMVQGVSCRDRRSQYANGLKLVSMALRRAGRGFADRDDEALAHSAFDLTFNPEPMSLPPLQSFLRPEIGLQHSAL